MKRVDLDELREKAAARDGAASTRVAVSRKPYCDVLTEPGGCEIYERCLPEDADFAVAAQPAVVIALLDRIAALELALEEATVALENHSLLDAADATRAVRKKGVVIP